MSLNLQDLLAIVGTLGTLMGFRWAHLNNSINDLRVDIKSGDEKLGADIKNVEEKLRVDIKNVEEKVDAVRDRVSRIEGQLVRAKVISFEEARPQEATRSSHGKAAQAQ